MANINTTVLSCNDPGRFAEIMKTASFSNLDDEIVYRNGEACISTRNSIPEGEITQMSQKNPDLVFTAQYTFEGDLYSEKDIVEYREGKSIFIDKVPNYSLIFSGDDTSRRYKQVMGESYEKLLALAEKIFRRIDIVKEDAEGGKHLDWIDNIGIIVQDDDFVMHILKGWEGYACSSGCMYVSKCFRKVKPTTVDLVEIKNPF